MLQHLTILLLLFLTATLQAAQPVKPPIEDSFKNRYVIATATFVEQTGTDYYFKLDTVLWDPRSQAAAIDSAQPLLLRFPAASVNQPILTADECYQIVFSQYRKHPIYHDEIEKNPAGRFIQQLPVVGPGVFSCNDKLETTYTQLKPGSVEEHINHSDLIDALLKLAGSGDQATRRLAIFELRMHADWAPKASSAQAGRLRHLMTPATISDELHEMLIHFAAALPPKQHRLWLDSHLHTVLKDVQTPLDLAGYSPLLIKTSLEILSRLGLLTPGDWPQLKSLLLSNAPGVAKSSLQAQHSLSSDQTLTEAKQLLESPAELAHVHPETRLALQRYIQQRE